jgi:hypothetical protein
MLKHREAAMGNDKFVGNIDTKKLKIKVIRNFS